MLKGKAATRNARPAARSAAKKPAVSAGRKSAKAKPASSKKTAKAAAKPAAKRTGSRGKAWTQRMPDDQFKLMRDILAAPSPIGLEAAMTYGVIKPYFERWMPKGWVIHQYKGHAAIVLDTHPGKTDMLTAMIIGHADKIRMQVRSVGEDGKIWIDSDSFLPATLLGNEVLVFSEDPAKPGTYRTIEGGTVEALGAIHFAEPRMRTGDKGISSEMLYLELGIHGDKKKQQILDLGVRTGDTVILNRPIRRGFAPDTFYGAYLDNGLGCFVATEAARFVAQNGPLKNVRCLFTMATYEEIGRFGSRVLAGELKPDVILATDVNHDYVNAPNVGRRRFAPIEMGKGATVSVGAIASEYLNKLVTEASIENGIPLQRDVCGRDTGTDGMAGVLASIDCAATSIGYPIRNMHTISETGHTGDVLAATHLIGHTLVAMDRANKGAGVNRNDFKNNHPRLDKAKPAAHKGLPAASSNGKLNGRK